MNTRQLNTFAFVAIIALLVLLAPSNAPPTAAQMQPSSFISPLSISDPARVSAALRNSPVTFIENVGQFADGARFQVRGANGTIYLADDAIWITVLERPQVDASRRRISPTPERFNAPREDRPRNGVNLKMSFVGANPRPRLEPFNRLDTHVSYFIGNDPAQWRADVPVWGGVRYKDLYSGIDLEITSESGRMVQRVVARAGANLNRVRLRVDGAEKIALDGDRLQLTTTVGEYTLPLLQLVGAASAKLSRPTIAGNQVTAPFTQSPTSNLQSPTSNSSDLLYATFLGGSDEDGGSGIAIDSSGAAYVTGGTWSSSFPTTPGVFDTSSNGGRDAFVVKLNATGSALTYATFLGGSDSECYYYDRCDIAVDSSGTAYVTGWTDSSDFPTTPGAFDTSYNGNGDAFIVKLNATGSALTYATFLGGSSGDYGNGIAIDSSGAAYVTGYTNSSDFPTTPGAFDTTLGGGTCYGYPCPDAFVVKLNATGSALTYATFLGGNYWDEGLGIAIDSSGAAYVTGDTSSSDFPTTPGAFDTSFNGYSDAFVVKLNVTGSALTYATFLGGSTWDWGGGIAIDPSGAAYVTGETWTSDFPTTPGAFDTSYNGQDAFVVKLNVTGSALTYATFLGGSDLDRGHGIAIDSSGTAYVTGRTYSYDFPTTPGAFDTSYSYSDAFVVKLNVTGSALTYATFLGGSDSECYAYYGRCDIAIDSSGAAYVTGWTDSSDFPTTPGAFDTSFNGYYDAFVVKLGMGGGGTAPTVATLVASLPTLTSATLNGSVNPNGSETNAWFEWGTDSNLTTFSSTPEQAIGTGATSSAVSAVISNLKPGLPYYFRIVARNSAGTARGQIQRLIILMGNTPSGSRYPQYWSKYDRLIYEWADQYNLYAPLVKAILAHESGGLGKRYDKPDLAFLYEPVTIDARYVTKAISKGTLLPPLSGYTLPDNPPASNPYNRFWNEFVSIPSGTTNQQMKSKTYLQGRAYGLTNPYGTPSSEFVAQYRIASSYGLGQVVYWWHHGLINGAPETLYNPEKAIEVAVRVLNVKRNKCAPSVTKTTSDFASWTPVLRAYNGGRCNSPVNNYVNAIQTQFSSYCQPVLAPDDFNPGGILAPQQVVRRQAERLSLSRKPSVGSLNPDEYEVDRLVADFKGTGQQQLAILYFVSSTPPDGESILDVSGGLKVFTDSTGQTLEWQSPLVSGTAGVGQVSTTTVSGGLRPLIVVEWASGAHGMWLHLFRWHGSAFEEIYPVGSDGSPLPGLFGDGGAQITSDGQANATSRDVDQPLALFNVATYTWTGQTFQWSKDETISNATYRLFLPSVLR